MVRSFLSFNHREANMKLWGRMPAEGLSSAPADTALTDRMIEAVIRNRTALDEYIRRRHLFHSALAPISDDPDAPPIARRMMEAARLTGLGPMAAVAGGFAQVAVEAALAGTETSGLAENPPSLVEAIAENGGDLVMALAEEMILGIHPGHGPLKDKLAFRITPEDTPVSICSSSGKMGHSLSFGRCDLATVVGDHGFIADAAATLGANLVKSPADISTAVGRLMEIQGVRGVLIVCDGQIGLGGKLPEIIKNNDPGQDGKITRDLFSE